MHAAARLNFSRAICNIRQINMLTDTPTTDDGWWYLSSETHHAANGASSQYMTAWNSRGEAVLTGMQSVAIFA